MRESIKDATGRAVLNLLDPLVTLLLKAGVGVGDLVALAKVAYVRAAREQARESGAELQRPNATRIAVVTGLTRVEVAALLAAGDNLPAQSGRGRHRAERVLAGWWSDDDFQDEDGTPAILPFKGATRSFAALCRRHSGETRPGAILDELLRAQAVRKGPDGRVQALSRTYATVGWDPDSIASVGEQLREHCEALAFNLQTPHRPRYVRRVMNSRLDPRYVRMLARDMERQADSLLETVGNALNDPQHTLKPGARDAQCARLGLALYMIDESARPGAPEPDSRRKVPAKKKRGRRQ